MVLSFIRFLPSFPSFVSFKVSVLMLLLSSCRAHDTEHGVARHGGRLVSLSDGASRGGRTARDTQTARLIGASRGERMARLAGGQRVTRRRRFSGGRMARLGGGRMARLAGGQSLSWADGTLSRADAAPHGRMPRLPRRLAALLSAVIPGCNEEPAGLCERGWGRAAAEREGSPSPISPLPLPLHCPFRHCTDYLHRLPALHSRGAAGAGAMALVAVTGLPLFQLTARERERELTALAATTNPRVQLTVRERERELTALAATTHLTCAAHGMGAGAGADGAGCNDSHPRAQESTALAAMGVQASRTPLSWSCGRGREPTALAGQQRWRGQRRWRDNNAGGNNSAGGDNCAGGDSGAGGEELGGGWRSVKAFLAPLCCLFVLVCDVLHHATRMHACGMLLVRMRAPWQEELRKAAIVEALTHFSLLSANAMATEIVQDAWLTEEDVNPSEPPTIHPDLLHYIVTHDPRLSPSPSTRPSTSSPPNASSPPLSPSSSASPPNTPPLHSLTHSRSLASGRTRGRMGEEAGRVEGEGGKEEEGGGEREEGGSKGVLPFTAFPNITCRTGIAELVDFAARCRLDYAASLVAESASVCPPSVRGECALSTDVLEDRQEEFQCFAAALPHLVSTLLAPEGDPDAPDIPTPRSYAEAIEGP
ncbi:unnamed protein product [Closterium sp. NIES-53]